MEATIKTILKENNHFSSKCLSFLFLARSLQPKISSQAKSAPQQRFPRASPGHCGSTQVGPGALVMLGDQPPAALHLVHQVGKVFFVFFLGGGGDAPGSPQVLCFRMGASSWLFAEVVPGLCLPAGTHTPFFGDSRRAARILHHQAAAESLQEGSAAATIRAEAVVLITELRGAERAYESSRTTGRKAAGTFLTRLPPGGARGTAHVLVVPHPGALHHCQGIPWSSATREDAPRSFSFCSAFCQRLLGQKQEFQ